MANNLRTTNDTKLWKAIRELFPDIPKYATSVTINLETDSMVRIDCSFFTEKPEDKE